MRVLLYTFSDDTPCSHIVPVNINLKTRTINASLKQSPVIKQVKQHFIYKFLIPVKRYILPHFRENFT